MTEFVRLSRPSKSQVTVNPNPQPLGSDAFNYPTLRLINKQARVRLSSPISPPPSRSHRLFAVANSRGWFAAVSSSGIILSSLSDLRACMKNAHSGNDSVYAPQRVLSVEAIGKPCVIAFGCNDSRFFVGFEQGQVATYDVSVLLSGVQDVQPLNVFNGPSATPIKLIAPNPGFEHSLANICAVLRGDGIVQLFNENLESQGGWAGEGDASPDAVSWSPKGKQIAIGLRSGDIFAYVPANKTAVFRHIPPTTNGTLSSLTWLPPGHTFRAVYTTSMGDIVDHIITVDVKTPTAKYFVLNHPFVLPDRVPQQYAAMLLRWDEQSAVQDEPRTLVLIGDAASTDLEVLGGIGFHWHQQSQENQLSLPLDQNMEETILLGLEVDLTDNESQSPIVYAYLSDGTTQAWYAEHQAPYPGIVTPHSADVSVMSTTPPPSAISVDEQKPSIASGIPGPQFAQTAALGSTQVQQQTIAGAFGQTGFGQPTFGASAMPSSAFGQASAFGHATQPAIPAPASGATSNPTSFGFGGFAQAGLSPFGSTPATGNMTREASMSDETSTFGGLSLGGGDSDMTLKPKTGIFGSTAFSSNPPNVASDSGGGIIAPATGFGAFKNAQEEQPKASTPFGSNALLIAPGSNQGSFNQAFGKPAFGQPAFGQSSFGKPAFPTTTGLGAFAPISHTASGPTPGSTAGGFASFATPTGTGGGFASFSGAPQAFGGAQNFGQAASESPTASDSLISAPVKAATPQGTPTRSDAVGSTTPPQTPSRLLGARSASSSPESEPKPSAPSTPVKAAAPGGAFANLTSSPSVIRPASGFGAFGSSSNESPFAARLASPAGSAGAFGGASTTPMATPVKPTGSVSFESPSPFRAESAITTPTKAASGAFSSFANSGSAFSAFTGASKSFSELLKSSADMSNKPISAFPPAEPSGSDAKAIKHEPQEDVKVDAATPAKPEASPSTKVPRPPSPEETEEPESSGSEVESDAGTEEEGEDEDDLSERSGSEGSEEDLEEVHISEVEDEETQPAVEAAEPKDVPLPPSRSPSTTPGGASALTSQSESRLKGATTPPSSPPLATTPMKATSSTPTPATPESPPGSPLPSKLGLGRPSTRPVRSSPLASTPVSHEGEEEAPSDNSTRTPSDAGPKVSLIPTFGGLAPTGRSQVAGDAPSSVFAKAGPAKLSIPVPSTANEARKEGGSNQEQATAQLPSGGFSFGFPQTKAFGGVTESPKLTFNKPPETKTSLTPNEFLVPQKSGAVPFGQPFSGGQTLGAKPSSLLNFGAAGTPPSTTTMTAPPLPSKPIMAAPFLPSKPGMAAPSLPPKPIGVPDPGPPTPQHTSESGMQDTCIRMIAELDQELHELHKLASESFRKRQELVRNRTSVRWQHDGTDPAQWGVFDPSQFKQIISKYHRDLDDLKELRTQLKGDVREAQSNMLKAGTRREEIARFTKANSDHEFAKMLKARTLGPERLETQTHLRRNIRTMRDRIQKLEDTLQASKKKINEMNSGKPSIKAPSLDTVNRTYRNIDIAVEQQSEDVSKLAARIARLSVKAPLQRALDRDPRLPDHAPKRAYNITPHVAVTTAAALNAEQSAHKLKQTLLNVRKEPLLNTTAVLAPPPPSSFDSPKKSKSSAPLVTPFRPSAAAPSSTSIQSLPSASTPVKPRLSSPPSPPSMWELPPDDFNPTTTPPSMRRGAGGTHRQHISVPLKRSTGSSPAAPPASFDWGPLPTFNMKPATTLVGEKLGPQPKATLPGFESLMKKS